MIIPVILAGGIGTRLWPLSRENYPKQFAKLMSEQSLLQLTALRCQPDNKKVERPIIITHEAHRFTVLQQLAEINCEPLAIIVEPTRRDTAPALAAAAFYLLNKRPDALMLVMPADHAIDDNAQFYNTIVACQALAENGKLIALGVKPTYPATGYGYIEVGEAIKNDAFTIKKFVEKPSAAVAEGFLKKGNFFWNSGIFFMSPAAYIDELKQAAPGIAQSVKKSCEKSIEKRPFVFLEPQEFEQSPGTSIDYAVMEKTHSGVVVPLLLNWTDVGSWDALSNYHLSDKENNVLRGNVIAEATKNSYLHANYRMLVALGVSDLIVVETRDAILVAHKNVSQEIKQLVIKLKEQRRDEAEFHCKVYRPWGHYETLEIGPRFLVKRIVVKKDASLSLQQHQYRAEHWVVVKGVAEVVCNDSTFLLKADESTYIPAKAKHRLRNQGETDLEIIEVQVGDVISEEDILRFEDDYGRS